MAKSWRRVRGWNQHGFACWDAEWSTYKQCAELAGKPVNGWIREWLNEAVRYEKLEQRERERDER